PLRRAISQYMEHFHRERNHQGLDNIIPFPIRPLNQSESGLIVKSEVRRGKPQCNSGNTDPPGNLSLRPVSLGGTFKGNDEGSSTPGKKPHLEVRERTGRNMNEHRAGLENDNADADLA